MHRIPTVLLLGAALTACGDDSSNRPIDAPLPPIDVPADLPTDMPPDMPIADAPPPPANHFHYAMDSLLVPMNNSQARDFGMDINGDGTVDNQLGMVLATLQSMGFELQAATTTSVD